MSNLIPFPKERVRRLPQLIWNSKKYFIDKRVGQIRNVNEPSDFVEFRDLPEEVKNAIAVVV